MNGKSKHYLTEKSRAITWVNLNMGISGNRRKKKIELKHHFIREKHFYFTGFYTKYFPLHSSCKFILQFF